MSIQSSDSWLLQSLRAATHRATTVIPSWALEVNKAVHEFYHPSDDTLPLDSPSIDTSTPDPLSHPDIVEFDEEC